MFLLSILILGVVGFAVGRGSRLGPACAPRALSLWFPRQGFLARAGMAVLLLAGMVNWTAAAEPAVATYRVTGMFSPDREDDLRRLIDRIPDLDVTEINYDRSEAVLRFDPARLFPGAKPEQVVERLDQLIRSSSSSTFGIRPRCTIPREKLEYVEIPVVGLDCKGCSLGAYEAVARLDGVEQATASFQLGLVTAWIDPARTHRTALEEALKKRNVQLK